MGRSRGFRFRYLVLAVIALTILGYLIFANTLIKGILEAQLSEAYGAQVDIGEFDHSLFPPRVEMHNIGLTNAREPEFNQVEVGTVYGDIELMPLLSSQVIVNQLSLLDVRFDQPRNQPGAVYRQPEPAFDFDAFKAEAKDAIPTVDELLARSALKSTAAVEQAQQVYDSYSGSLKTQYKGLPKEDRLDYYKSQVKALKETNYKDPQALLKARETLDKLKQEMEQDKGMYSEFASHAQQARLALNQSVKALSQAPKQDYDLLKGALMGDQAALSQITQMVFGAKAEEYTGYLMSAIDIVVPLLQGNQDNQADESASEMPAVLVRQANVSVNWKDERIESQWQNITNMHSLFGQPTTFTIAAASQMLKKFESSGQFWLDENGVDASQVWELAGIDLADIQFTQNKTLNAALSHALLNSKGSMSVKNNLLSGDGIINLADMAMQASGDSKVTQAIASALNALSTLALNMSLDGTLEAPGFHISSDLDNQLARSALNQLSASQQDKLNELNSKLNALVAGQKGASQQQIVSVDKMLALAQGNTEELETLLSTQLDSVVEKETNKLLDKLKDKLGRQN